MLAALALTGAALFILTGLVLTARLVRIGNLDAISDRRGGARDDRAGG